MPRRKDDHRVSTNLSPAEYAQLKALAARERCTVAELFRRAINAMTEESGDAAVFVEPRVWGRPRKELR